MEKTVTDRYIEDMNCAAYAEVPRYKQKAVWIDSEGYLIKIK